jgi:hypothetical protein
MWREGGGPGASAAVSVFEHPASNPIHLRSYLLSPMLTPWKTQLLLGHIAQIMLRYGSGRATSKLSKTLRNRQYATAGPSPKQTPISGLETNRFLPYPKLQDALRTLRRRLDRSLTLSEKLLYTHLRNPLEQELERGKSFLLLDPDRAACHDATATMAMLQFISAGLPRTMLPTSIHSDHLIVAENGAAADLANAKDDYAEVSLGRAEC